MSCKHLIAVSVGILGASSSWASLSYEISIPGPKARISCSLDRTNGRVRMLFDLSGFIATGPVLKTAILETELRSETWARPDRIQRLCKSQMEELLRRSQITGEVWVEKKSACVCHESDCAITESHSIYFSPLKEDGYQRFSFSAYGRKRYKDPDCYYQEPNQ